MKKSIASIIGFFVGILVCFITQQFVKNMFSYQDLDVIVKFLGCLGTITAALFVWWKWNDEKNRVWFEKRLKEVYVPLLVVIIRQERYRELFLKSMPREKVPIFYIKKTGVTAPLSKPESKITKTDGLIRQSDILEAIETIDKSLAEPKLLKIIVSYKLLIELKDEFRSSPEYKEYEEAEYSLRSILTGSNTDREKAKEELMSSEIGKKMQQVQKIKVNLEKELVNEIINGYNKSIKKLGFSDELFDMEFK